MRKLCISDNSDNIQYSSYLWCIWVCVERFNYVSDRCLGFRQDKISYERLDRERGSKNVTDLVSDMASSRDVYASKNLEQFRFLDDAYLSPG